jgi:hypothetical protein
MHDGRQTGLNAWIRWFILLLQDEGRAIARPWLEPAQGLFTPAHGAFVGTLRYMRNDNTSSFFIYTTRICLAVQTVLCSGQPASWQSLEQYRMLSVLKHPEHCLSPNFLPQNEHGTSVAGLLDRALHCCKTSMQRSRVVSALSINALQMINMPFTVAKGSPSISRDCFFKDSRSFLLKVLQLPRGIRLWCKQTE